MFIIHDAPDPAPVEAWIGRFIAQPCDDLVLLTGEGLRRLLKVTRRLGNEAPFVAALGKARKIARGPKPVKALREVGLEAQLIAEKPTSEGVIETLAALDLAGHRVGIQLYPDNEHAELLGALRARAGEVDPVLPYAYDAKAAEANVVAAIREMAQGRIDALALTNAGQFRRLVGVAEANGLGAELRAGLSRTKIASVGPTVDEELKAHDLSADIRPAGDTFFMRPLISAMAAALVGDGVR